MRRRVGAEGWERAGPALARQTRALLALLDELGVRATFFILGIAAREHTTLLEAVLARGHEIACHGDRHLPVHSQTPQEFGADLRAARATIEKLTGRTPLGYRAPSFSITRASQWAFDVLAAEGFAYDSSQHDSARIRDRVRPDHGQPHVLELAHGASIWEFPLAVWRIGRARLPVGGASYWAALPRPLVLRGLTRAGPMAGLYLHPHEFDPEPLRAQLASGAPLSQRAHAHLRAMQRNSARGRAARMLRAIAQRHRLITYGEAYAELSGSSGASARALPHEGEGIR